MLEKGFQLMVSGMGTVFLFLGLMVIIINITAKLVAPFAHLLREPEPAKRPVRKKAEPKADNEEQDMITAAIAAVHKFRQDR